MRNEITPRSDGGTGIVGWIDCRLSKASERMCSIVKNPGAFVERVMACINSRLAQFLPDSRLGRSYRRRIFQETYRKKRWGTDGVSRFFSGVGSHGVPAITYVSAMAPIISEHLNGNEQQATIIDLGCGDFSVGARLLERLPKLQYIGCDVVPEIVEYNQRQYGNQFVQFQALDIVSEDLPDGDICLVRQVLQHLSNRDITCVLSKLRKYPFVYVTEAQPLLRIGKPNPDKPANHDVRFDWRTGRGRGVELDQPPWNLHIEEVILVPRSINDTEIVITYRIDFSLCSDRQEVAEIQKKTAKA